MLCGSLDGSGVWGNMEIYVCVAQSLYCSPETITILLIDYTPIQNKILKKIKINKLILKINTQKSIAFLYINTEKSERDIKESIPFTTETKIIKHL